MQAQFVFSSARTAVALAIGAGALFAATAAHAQVVSSGIVNLAIPASTNGLYLNVVNGANNLPAPGTAGSTVPGWDINPWGGTGFGFFSPSAPLGGAYVLSAPSTVGNLAPGATVSGASTFGSGATANTAQWLLNSSDNFFGFRFVNEAGGGSLHYGWAQIAFGSTLTNRTLVQYAFEATPMTAIAVVPEPGTYALMSLGLLGVAAAARRRMQKKD
ncbi:MAG: PEP-CTERM sorting domain-containing protein [Rubrivivax sp.]|nr:PEP-CTERM sorting domain-containing protein [Rubrivivax sp.]